MFRDSAKQALLKQANQKVNTVDDVKRACNVLRPQIVNYLKTYHQKYTQNTNIPFDQLKTEFLALQPKLFTYESNILDGLLFNNKSLTDTISPIVHYFQTGNDPAAFKKAHLDLMEMFDNLTSLRERQLYNRGCCTIL